MNPENATSGRMSDEEETFVHRNIDSIRMIRREARLRREYLYRKSVEEKQKALDKKREIVKRSIDLNRKIPTHLKRDAIALAKDSEWGGPVSSMDDEYYFAESADPKVVITTSREPSAKLKVFAKEMRLMFPNSQRMNRGHYEMKTLIQACKANDVTDLIVLSETRGTPDGMVVCHLPIGPTAYFNLSNVVMRHDVPDRETVSEVHPNLIFTPFYLPNVGERIQTILKHLYPEAKKGSKRVMTFCSDGDFMAFRHHTYSKNERGEIELKEIGPRFNLRPYLIKRGTLDQAEASDTEWVLRPYMNTANKKALVSLTETE